MLNKPPPIEGVDTGVAGFAGADLGSDTPELVRSAADFERSLGAESTLLGRVVRGFFDNGGTRAYVAGSIGALEAIDDVVLLCPLPEDTEEAIAQCERRRDRIAILSLPAGLGSVEQALSARPPEASSFAAVHHPWVWAGGGLTPPGGHVAGVYANRHAHPAAPTAQDLRGLDDPPLERALSEPEVAVLVEGAINPLRGLHGAGRGVRVRSTRTLDAGSEFSYIPVRRLMIFLERSIESSLQWVVFEPNGEPLWASVRASVETFLMDQWRAGALKGHEPEEAFFVHCDRTTISQGRLDEGRLICVIGVALVHPAEFVIFRIGLRTADPCRARRKPR